ncbi:MAG: glutamate--tRNA ligase [Nanoarchaeota archaeon]|nr:glutamate--tRNA ligase [Nanoarchaeota archaeon]
MEDVIKKYALKNSVDYGKANPKFVMGKILSENPKLKKDIQNLLKKVEKVVNEVNKLSKEQKEEELKNFHFKEKKVEERKLRELPNAKNVIMRLAPYPSGPLHLGNAKPYIINDEYVKKYKGKLLLVIDDTIGSKEKNISKDAYKLIPEGLKWLDIKYSKVYYKSDRLEIYYKYAEDLIKKDKAYVCSCSSEKIKENRYNGVECSCRDNKDNLKLWKDMFKSKEGSYVLRIKTDMKYKDPAFRDRVLFRISERKHPRVGNKYRVWPLLEFSWAIDDHLLNITHIIRGKELMIESEMEKYIWDIFGWKHPVLIHTGLLQIKGVKLSKSKSKQEVESKKYTGWDDPRTFSLQSLEKRGIQKEAIREFILGFGLNQNEITVPIDVLYEENKKIIDKRSDRSFVVFGGKIKIKNAPKMKAKVLKHPDFKKRGYRNFDTSDEFYVQDKLEKNILYRFIHLFNFKNKEFVGEEYDKEAKLIHWVPVKDAVKVKVTLVDGKVIEGYGEKGLKDVKINDVVQFERNFFACLNKKGKFLEFSFSHT